MTIYRVKELMVPLAEYATVPEGTSLFDAVLALEKAQEEFDDTNTKYKHLAVLVLDKTGQVVGRLSQMDVVRAFDGVDHQAGDMSDLNRFGFSDHLVRDMIRKRLQPAGSLSELCRKVARYRVEDYMQAPTPGEYIDSDAPMEMAVFQLVNGLHASLLVTHEKCIVGVLRLTDVFAAIFHVMKKLEGVFLAGGKG